jgi:lipoate-protein ligase A
VTSDGPRLEPTAPGWQVERRRGSGAELHALDWPDPLEPTVWLLDVERPALVLGSTQSASTVDAIALTGWGIELAGRRSGGGAVLLVPGQSVWIDVFIPASHLRWDADVNRSFHWLGEVWVAALADLGVEAAVHRGGLVRTAQSDRVCFAGLGAGEVTIAGAKAVGLSQRRTRAGARFQCVVHRSWDSAPLAAIAGVTPEDLPPVATLANPVASIETALLRQLA